MGLLIIIGIIIIFGIISYIISTIREQSWSKYNEIQCKWTEAQHHLTSERNELKIQKAAFEKEIQEKRNEIEQERNNLFSIREDLKLKHEFQNKQIENFDKIIKEKCAYYPQLAAIMSDLLTVHYEESAQFLYQKKNPAKVEAYRIKELKKETTTILQEKKLYEYQLAYLKELFPDIDKYFDNDYEVVPEYNTLESNTDAVSRYITSEEYRRLSVSARNQLALDNYIANRKSKWQIGRDYELYTGYLYQQKGYHIEYNGIIKRLEDMGRDIIATKDNETLIIQCKNWSKEKTIHENHIFQLYGSVVYARIENPFFDIKGVFITTIRLSKTAQEVARYLGIEVIEQFPLGEFPRIKCNINKSTGEKIYHLPFDQQYDSTKIESEGEFFAFTVEEAERKGFRRAWRHTYS